MRWILLIVFKVVEIAAFIFVPYFLGRLVAFICRFDKEEIGKNLPPHWVTGIFVMIAVFVLYTLGVANLEWIDSMLGR